MQKLEDKIAADSSSIKTKDEELDKVKNEKKDMKVNLTTFCNIVSPKPRRYLPLTDG